MMAMSLTAAELGERRHGDGSELDGLLDDLRTAGEHVHRQVGGAQSAEHRHAHLAEADDAHHRRGHVDGSVWMDHDARRSRGTPGEIERLGHAVEVDRHPDDRVRIDLTGDERVDDAAEVGELRATTEEHADSLLLRDPEGCGRPRARPHR